MNTTPLALKVTYGVTIIVLKRREDFIAAETGKPRVGEAEHRLDCRIIKHEMPGNLTRRNGMNTESKNGLRRQARLGEVSTVLWVKFQRVLREPSVSFVGRNNVHSSSSSSLAP
jgi:hypothetical protein